MVRQENTHYFVDGGQTAAVKPYLIIVSGGSIGQVHLLARQAEYLLGRSDEAEINLTPQTVSRRHAKITHNLERFFVEDLGTLNGTYLNNVKITSVTPLQSGDFIRVGGAVVKFVFADCSDAAFYNEMYRLATRDPLTDLGNRRYFLDTMTSSLGQLYRKEKAVSFIILDVDHFKKINDNFGHAIGDNVLRELADTMRSCLREHDIEGRIGGEEFAVFLPDTDATQAIRVAERIRQAFEIATRNFGDTTLSCTISTGVTTIQLSKSMNIVSILKLLHERADKALYASKTSGRNRTSYFAD